MKLKRVTITGVDGNGGHDMREMGRLSQEYPFLEWGILATNQDKNTPRFPSYKWISDATGMCSKTMNFALHLCGRYVRDLCKGESSFLDMLHPSRMDRFQRIQINFSCYTHLVDKDRMLGALLDSAISKKQIILQFSEPNYDLLNHFQDGGLDVTFLLDKSGGTGKVPSEWDQYPGSYCGYAGGLSSKNITSELKKIDEVVGDNFIWIDSESGHRDSKNRFVFKKAADFLALCKEWVDPEAFEITYRCHQCNWAGLAKDLIHKSNADNKAAIIAYSGGPNPSLKVAGWCPSCPSEGYDTFFDKSANSYVFNKVRKMQMHAVDGVPLPEDDMDDDFFEDDDD